MGSLGARAPPSGADRDRQDIRNAFRIANPGPTDLFIQRVRALPRIYGVAKDHSMRAKMAALESADVNVLLRSGQEHDLPIIDLRNEEDKNVSRWVHFVVYWRKTSSTWLPQAAVVIGTSTRAIEQIGAAVAAQWDQVP